MVVFSVVRGNRVLTSSNCFLLFVQERRLKAVRPERQPFRSLQSKAKHSSHRYIEDGGAVLMNGSCNISFSI